MKYRRRVFFTDKQKSQIWDRWQRGELMSSTCRVFDRGRLRQFTRSLRARAASVHQIAYGLASRLP
jgi:hypothetical protein